MYGSDAGQPVPSLYTKGLSPLCDTSATSDTSATISATSDTSATI